MDIILSYDEACNLIAERIPETLLDGTKRRVVIQRKKRGKKGEEKVVKNEGVERGATRSLVEYLNTCLHSNAEAFTVARIKDYGFTFKEAEAIYKHWDVIADRARKAGRVPTPIFESSHSNVVTNWVF